MCTIFFAYSVLVDAGSNDTSAQVDLSRGWLSIEHIPVG